LAFKALTLVKLKFDYFLKAFQY